MPPSRQAWCVHRHQRHFEKGCGLFCQMHWRWLCIQGDSGEPARGLCPKTQMKHAARSNPGLAQRDDLERQPNVSLPPKLGRALPDGVAAPTRPTSPPWGTGRIVGCGCS
eukprot:4016344-Prymnesium_polylepis.1